VDEMQEDISLRWKQRFNNFANSRLRLYSVITEYRQNPINKNIQLSLIESFLFTFKLAWKSVKDYLIYQGIKDINFPREVIKKGFKYQTIQDGQLWIDIIEDTSLISYKDNENMIPMAVKNITEKYIQAIDQVYEYLRIKNKTILKYGLSEKVLKMISDVFADYPDIYEVKIYGSRAFGNCDHASDIDLAYFTKSSKKLSDEIQSKLEALPTPYLFDVTDYNKIKYKPLKDNIDKVGRTIYKK
jgi:nucleotidyltransferase substrate binding protein (TIGR01987 family)